MARGSYNFDQFSGVIWNTFNAGELSPLMDGRVDLDRYANGARILENFIPYPHGGVAKRPGWRYVAPAKGASRMIPFVFSESRAYVLEVGPGWIRFFTDEGQIFSGATIYEVANPYSDITQVEGIGFCQSADIQYWAHANVEPQKLSRMGHTDWTLATVTFTAPSTAWTGTTQPSVVTFFEDRSCWAAWPGSPQTLKFSRTGDPEDLTTGTASDDGMVYTISSDFVNPIMWMVPQSVLVVGTIGSVWSAGARSSVEPLTPTNRRFERVATYGTNSTPGQVVGNSVIFCSRGGNRILEMSYKLEQDGLMVRDLTLLAPHIVGGVGIKELAWGQDPDHVLYALRKDGVLLAGTYYPNEDVMGWCRLPTKGEVQSICVIPYGGRDQLWACIKRNLNKVETYTIEVMESLEFDEDADAFRVDCGLSYTASTPVSTISGLGHLEGEEVMVVAGGAVHPSQTVASGQISLEYAATPIHVGLGYTAVLQTMRPEVVSRMGSAMGRMRKAGKTSLLLYRSGGGKFGRDQDSAQVIPWRKSDDLMDTAPPLYSGWRQMPAGGGFDRDGRLTIVHHLPLPFTLSAIVTDLAVNER